MKYTFEPLGDLVVIRKRQVTDIGGIILMEQDTRDEQFAEVVSTGPDIVNDIGKGDLIIYAQGMINQYTLPDNSVVETIPERYIRGKINVEN